MQRDPHLVQLVCDGHGHQVAHSGGQEALLISLLFHTMNLTTKSDNQQCLALIRHVNPFNAMAIFVNAQVCKDFCKPSKPCRVGIH